MTDADAKAQHQFGGDSPGPVRASRGGVDGTDRLGQLGVPQRPRRQGPFAPLVVPGLSHTEQAAGQRHRMPVSGHPADGHVPVSWGHHPVQQLQRPLGGGELGLQRGDLAVRCSEFALLGRRQARLDTAVDSILAPPVVDRLVTDVQVSSDVDDLAAGSQQIEDLPTELRWIATTSHACLLQSGGTRILYQRLRQTRGTPGTVRQSLCGALRG
jgi:hypothetical protein